MKKIIGILICMLLIFTILPAVNSFYNEKGINDVENSLDSGPMDSDWPMYHHDVRHTDRSPLNFNFTTGMIKWKLWLGQDSLKSSPVIDKNGIIYVGINPYNHWIQTDFYAIYPNGTIKWNYTPVGKETRIYQ